MRELGKVGVVHSGRESIPIAPLPGALTATPASGEPLLEIRGLRTEIATQRGIVRAIDGVDLTVRRGEVLALVGESGSGKTMTALSIMRLLPPQAVCTSGSITLHGIDLLALSEAEMNHIRGGRVALLFQQPRAALDPTSKVGSQVAEGARLHCGAARREAWNRGIGLLADVGIAEPKRRADAYAYQLSGGMAQRVMIAAGLSGEPELLIADEPTTSLDVTVQAQILELLATKREETGLAMLLITHDLSIVASVADRVAVMYAGRIVEEAPIKDIFSAPQHPYTQALIQASLLERGEDGRLFTIPGGPDVQSDSSCGCRFCSRCSLADTLSIRSKCEAVEPELTACDDEHVSRCWASAPKVTIV
jgi:peptide/nickel transport system ATP-binding protein